VMNSRRFTGFPLRLKIRPYHIAEWQLCCDQAKFDLRCPALADR